MKSNSMDEARVMKIDEVLSIILGAIYNGVNIE
jgi:hypothetical protein